MKRAVRVAKVSCDLWTTQAAGQREAPQEEWSGRLDLNQRPHAPQACALPGCATSRLFANAISVSLAFEKGQDREKFFMQVKKKFLMRARRR
jgi:hypothetical protein